MDISVLSAIFTVIGAISSVLAVIITIRISRRIPEEDILSHRQRIGSLMRDLRAEMESGKRN